MSDLLDTPDGLDNLEGGLTEDLIEEQDEDSALLEDALGDVSAVDKDSVTTPIEETEAEEPGDNLLDETNDNVQVEEDPV